MKSEVFGVI